MVGDEAVTPAQALEELRQLSRRMAGGEAVDAAGAARDVIDPAVASLEALCVEHFRAERVEAAASAARARAGRLFDKLGPNGEKFEADLRADAGRQREIAAEWSAVDGDGIAPGSAGKEER